MIFKTVSKVPFFVQLFFTASQQSEYTDNFLASRDMIFSPFHEVIESDIYGSISDEYFKSLYITRSIFEYELLMDKLNRTAFPFSNTRIVSNEFHTLFNAAYSLAMFKVFKKITVDEAHRCYEKDKAFILFNKLKKYLRRYNSDGFNVSDRLVIEIFNSQECLKYEDIEEHGFNYERDPLVNQSYEHVLKCFEALVQEDIDNNHAKMSEMISKGDLDSFKNFFKLEITAPFWNNKGFPKNVNFHDKIERYEMDFRRLEFCTDLKRYIKAILSGMYIHTSNFDTCEYLDSLNRSIFKESFMNYPRSLDTVFLNTVESNVRRFLRNVSRYKRIYESNHPTVVNCTIS